MGHDVFALSNRYLKADCNKTKIVHIDNEGSTRAAQIHDSAVFADFHQSTQFSLKRSCLDKSRFVPHGWI